MDLEDFTRITSRDDAGVTVLPGTGTAAQASPLFYMPERLLSDQAEVRHPG